MPSDYDALLTAEAPKSEYDVLTSAASAVPSTPAAYLEDKLLTAFGATPHAREIVSNAESGLAETLKSFVPQSLSQALGFVTPVVSAYEDVKKTVGTLGDVVSGKTLEESMRANHPEDFALVDAEKTPAFSRERFAAGFGTVAQMLMAAGMVKGFQPKAVPKLTETLFPEAPPDGTYKTATGEFSIQSNRPTTIPPEEVTQHAEQITKAAQPDGLRTEPEVPPPTQEPAVAQSGEGIPASRQGPEIQEVAPPTVGELIEQAPMAEVIAPEPSAEPTVRAFRGPADAFGSEVTPVAQYLTDSGVLSKSAAKKAGKLTGNEDLWNGAGDILSHPTHNKIYKPTGEMPDVAAQNLYDAGLIKEPTQDAMWEALRHESQTSRTLAREQRDFSAAEKTAHAEWQDQLKTGEQDPAIALRSAGGEAGIITKSADGKSVELSLLGENGDPKVTETHATLDEALKSAHEIGMRLDDNSENGQPLFEDATPPRASTEDLAPPGETPGASPEAGAAPPKLRPGEKQGDLLASQTEDLSLVGEKGVDHAARQAAEEAAAGQKSEYDALTEAAQGKLFEPNYRNLKQEDITNGQVGRFRVVGSRGRGDFKPESDFDLVTKLTREEEAAWENTPEGDYPVIPREIKHAANAGHDVFIETKEGHAWKVEPHPVSENPNHVVVERVSGVEKKLLAGLSREHDWTGATAPSGKGMTLSKTAGQAAAIPNPLASPIVAKALKTIEARKMSPLDASTTERSARLQQSFADAERAQKEIAKVAPNERRQAAISIWMEANGDAQTLSQWAAAAKGKAFREAATAAQSLSAEELAIAQKARGAFDVLEKRGNTYDVLSNHRDNYVPHVWEVSKDFTGIGSSKLQDRFKFNKARTFENFFEGDQAGFQPKTMAIGKLLPAYLHEMNKVIADRQFIQDLQAKGATASDGSPLVIPRGRVTTIDTDSGGKAYLADPNAYKNAKDAAGNPIDQSKYKVIGDQPALNDWRWESKDEQGNPIYMKDDLAVHPELAKRLNATMGQSAIRQWYNEPSTGVAVIPKAIAKGLDTAQSVMKREMFSLLAPFHQVQEGTHAVGHTVNPFGGLQDMSRPTPEHVDAMRHGLMLLPDKSSSAGYIEGLGGKGGFIAQAGRWLGEKAGDNVIGKAANAIASTIDGYQNYLFHQYIPALKFKTYEHILERNTARYGDDLKSGKLTEADVKLLSAEQSNAAYGHINYALLDRNPTMHHITQLALLAPDFLEARGRFVGQAAKSLIGEKAGHEQFRAIAVLAATQAATMFTLSKVLGGEWDWKHPFEMTVNNRRYMLRSVPEDLHRLLFQGPDIRREFVSARVNPTLQKVDQLRTGLNYRGEKTGALDTMGELIANYIPITARSLPGVRRLTETSRNSPVSPLEQLAGSMGIKISRYSAITHTHQLASEWMDKQKIERPAGVYPTSKFTPLRYALEDADLPRAEKEWKKLIGDAGNEKKLADGFKLSIMHPFTGNKSRDQDFANSLKGKDRLLYDRALEVREGILDKFSLIR